MNIDAKNRGGEVRGDLNLTGLRIGIVVSRFNSFITDRLLSGALDALQSVQGAGGPLKSEQIEIVRVPGSLELPIAAAKLVETRGPDAVICIGCVLRGETSHYDLVCSEVARGVQLAQLDTKTPMIFCVLTCDTLEQAIDRAGLKSGNKGFEAGLAAVEMATLFRKLEATSRADAAEIAARAEEAKLALEPDALRAAEGAGGSDGAQSGARQATPSVDAAHDETPREKASHVTAGAARKSRRNRAAGGRR